jgi:hypothetical protein
MPRTGPANENPVILSGLKGMSTWCNVCTCMTDHNTLYHQDVINLHREQRNPEAGDIDLGTLLLVGIFICLVLLVFKAF